MKNIDSNNSSIILPLLYIDLKFKRKIMITVNSLWLGDISHKQFDREVMNAKLQNPKFSTLCLHRGFVKKYISTRLLYEIKSNYTSY